jgi:uncharacterized pyridoxamine 5'-phosphate oxidase family protein
MSKRMTVRTFIEDIFKIRRFAVLATESDGQPHASLIGFTPIEGFRKLIFATYRNTQKFRNLAHNGRVAVLIESNDMSGQNLQESIVLTAFGHIEDIGATERKMVFEAHLQQHPQLLAFMQSEDCSLIQIKVDSYQIVRGIDDVEWWTIADLDAPPIGE